MTLACRATAVVGNRCLRQPVQQHVHESSMVHPDPIAFRIRFFLKLAAVRVDPLRCARGRIRCEIGEIFEQAQRFTYGILNGGVE